MLIGERLIQISVSNVRISQYTKLGILIIKYANYKQSFGFKKYKLLLLSLMI
ncbi:hypothetical protein A1OE_1014 [Candidatus Endolissoclinum faulkneri L2]|uniref:Uncharacterized protein n=1 Tax=Candidatus Endolissoclinum faulkneri L2 TaxID=1193729 RepID=K7Z563_9PROT|nr:hypothetical protein A1OE_1014 [Candidatus Endolissoclinum faulkneri L2]